MRKLVLAVACMLVFGLGGTAAHAQFDKDLSEKWQLRAGIFIPTSDVARIAAGDFWLSLGAQREVFEGERYKGYLSVDYYGDKNIYSVPIQLNIGGETGRFRYGTGAGFALAHDTTHGLTSFVFNLGVGYSWPTGKNPITTDIRWYHTSNTNELNGFAVTLGFKF